MLTSIATVSLSGTLEEKLEAVARAGFQGVEIFENDLITSPNSPEAIGRMVADNGLTCTVYQPFRDFEGMPDMLRQRTFDRAESKFDTMQAIGTDLVLVCSNVSPESSGDRARIVDDFRELGDRAASRGLRIGFEALAWGRHVNDHRDAWDIVRMVDHPAVGLILDSFHSLVRDVPIFSISGIDPAKIFLVQLADAPQLDMDYLSWSRHFRNLPGQGELPVVDYYAAIDATGYSGPYSLEIFNDRFRAGSTTGIARDGHRSLLWLADAAARKSGGAKLPDPMKARAVEFIEFATDEREGSQLMDLLASLGFARVGRHRSKAVQLWRQGGINFVVNSEREGFAHSHDVVHGASVCAIALAVDSPEAAMARAEALGMTRFDQAVGPGEMEIPSLRSVGGSLMYLIRHGEEARVWQTDFELEPQPEAEGAGLTRIDHIGYSMAYDEFLSWQLYFLSLMESRKTPPLEIADPGGLVENQSIESVDGEVRFTLNGSSSQQTLAARFLQRYLGAGVQYISLRSEDIFATAERLQQLGMPPLPIPDNYYADLKARFGLDAEFVEQLRQGGILYDRTAEGEYFQFYSRAFAKRFFFEIVERRNYEGYGAINTPVRLAAQARYKEPVID